NRLGQCVTVINDATFPVDIEAYGERFKKICTIGPGKSAVIDRGFLYLPGWDPDRNDPEIVAPGQTVSLVALIKKMEDIDYEALLPGEPERPRGVERLKRYRPTLKSYKV